MIKIKVSFNNFKHNQQKKKNNLLFNNLIKKFKIKQIIHYNKDYLPAYRLIINNSNLQKFKHNKLNSVIFNRLIKMIEIKIIFCAVH